MAMIYEFGPFRLDPDARILFRGTEPTVLGFQLKRGEGYQVRIYVPYGTQWYGYLMRRLAERPANMMFFARALTSRK